LDDRVDASYCTAAAGFMTVVVGSDREVLVDARDVLCKFLFLSGRKEWCLEKRK
jgi:hypothetical protein